MLSLSHSNARPVSRVRNNLDHATMVRPGHACCFHAVRCGLKVGVQDVVQASCTRHVQSSVRPCSLLRDGRGLDRAFITIVD